MGAAFSLPILRIFIILGLSLLFKFLVRGRVRDSITPWCIALILFEPNAINFVAGALHFQLIVVYWLCMAFVLDGCSLRLGTRNPQLLMWTLFWGYLTLTSFWSDEPFMGVMWYVNVYLELFLIGYFGGIWLLRTPDAWRKLRVPMLVCALLTILVYRHFGFGGELDHNSRAVLDMTKLDEDMGNNVNDIGLAIVPILVVLEIIFVEVKRRGVREIIMKGFVLVAMLGTALYLIRTGSRNACLAILPCGWFLLFGGGKRGGVRIVMVGVISMMAFAAVGFFMKGADSIRAFKFFEKGEKFDIEKVSSGRIEGYRAFLYPMHGMDWVVGKGPCVINIPGMPKRVHGCLSVYVTLLYNVGVFGLFLLLLVFLSVYIRGWKTGPKGQLVILLFSVWAITGIAEGKNIRRSCTLCFVQGVAFAMCTRLPIGWDRRMRYGAPPYAPMPSEFGPRSYGRTWG